MSDSIDPKPLPEPSDVGVSQAAERDAALAAVIREQTQKAEMEARARKIRIRRQGVGLQHLTLFPATAISVWICVWPPAFQGMEYVRLTNSDYRILGRTGRVTLSYSSVKPLDTFVGAGATVLNPLAFNWVALHTWTLHASERRKDAHRHPADAGTSDAGTGD